jgi:hypothetical protein
MIRHRVAGEAVHPFQPKFQKLPKITESVGGSLLETAMPRLGIG